MAVFDIVKSHDIELEGLIHNEAQGGKSELDSSFYHFKRQLKICMLRFKSAILTPQHMANYMEYANGVKNYRFDIIELNRKHLELLHYAKDQHYGALKTA